MKTIGVLGGIGPQATMDFEQRVHRAAQERNSQHFNNGYPPMVVIYLRHAPVLLTETGAPRQPLQPDPRMLEAAKTLGSLCNFLVITSNGCHVFLPQIERESGREVLSMIDLTIAEVQRRGWKKVGVLGMGEPVVYMRPLAALNIETEILEPDAREKLNGCIFRVMEGSNTSEHASVVARAITVLRDRKVDGVILGCTELPFLVRDADNAPDLINPIALLAPAALERAMESA